jgi:hypothetical protein
MASKKADAASISGSVSRPLQEAIIDDDQANEITVLLCTSSSSLSPRDTTGASPEVDTWAATSPELTSSEP